MNAAASPSIFKVALPLPLPLLFDYLAAPNAQNPLPGSRVLAPFGKRKLVGIVVRVAEHSELPREKLQELAAYLDDGEPVFDRHLLDLLDWCAHYYKHPIGEVFHNALPPALRKVGGFVPEPLLQFCLTGEGRARLEQPVGRAVAQYRVLEALQNGPLVPRQLAASARQASRVLPRLQEQGWVKREPWHAPMPRFRDGPDLNNAQAAVLEEIQAQIIGFSCHLVDGITGSGKTEIYLRLLQQVLASGKQALVLVPEIGLTPQLVRRFSERLGLEPAVSHSGIAAGQRLRVWADAGRGNASLVIGTRSALFLPLPNPGLIIMDECHDSSFKQQDGFRFAARDVAVKRAFDLDIPIVLGTATPSLETLHNAETGRYRWHRLRTRATGAAQPAWRVLDLRHRPATAGLCRETLEAMQSTLDRAEQVLVFLNRRGYAPVLLCHECGWHAACQRCDANMTWHRGGNCLICHHCEHRHEVPRFCPECSADALQGAGEGTEQLERMLAGRFSGFPLYRVDRDQVRRKGDLDRIVEAVRSGEPCILVGTQMLAKGHHFPKVTLVVVVSLDQALYSADFRAIERMGQLLMQVAGRAGREQHPGEVILQTHHPDHPVLERLFRSGYECFARELLEERKLAGLPPFSHQAVLRAEATDRTPVLEFLNHAARAWPNDGKGLFGPFPALMEKKGGRFRWYLLAQDVHRSTLQSGLDRWLPLVRGLSQSRQVRWSVDVDPLEF